ncbi:MULTISPECIES: DUF6011 domain-containing protein [unclassified Streptomyces]|uniref:DUF6011 domain-containing protein n=1 Tax=unclassified Streptomyces TaxID=2593676 RepID=UPI000805CC92|nr:MULTISPECIES: DUF6011 domain-containing protein [unclassified Streptomyces]MYR75147.1 hypothetical protein [Streptomyces sp. SID4925]SBU98045.1 hypothetical protein YUMDRAFT_06018 [Streptomyces sp. OspMP-M45]
MTNQQQLHLDTQAPAHRYRYCRRCGRPLTAPGSRFRGFGPDCDPTRHPTAAATRDIDQDALPGT